MLGTSVPLFAFLLGDLVFSFKLSSFGGYDGKFSQPRSLRKYIKLQRCRSEAPPVGVSARPSLACAGGTCLRFLPPS